MAEDTSSNKMTPVSHRCSRTKFTAEQLKTLVSTFNQKPYLDYATVRKLALAVNTDESRIQIWFQNRRARHPFQKRPELKEALESSHEHGGGHFPGWTQGGGPRRHRTTYTSSQLYILVKAFMSNPYPGIDSREQLAKEIGVPESRVQVWFQNQRARVHVWIKTEPDGSLEEGQVHNCASSSATLTSLEPEHGGHGLTWWISCHHPESGDLLILGVCPSAETAS